MSDSAESTELKPSCQHEECLHEAILCYLPEEWGDSSLEFFCREHAPDHGYCCVCGSFWGGVTSFDLNRNGLCEYCEADI